MCKLINENFSMSTPLESDSHSDFTGVFASVRTLKFARLPLLKVSSCK